MNGKPERRAAGELRADGSRLIGVAMRYGELARIPGIGRERFEAGAFGDVAAADVILDRQHLRDRPLARTNGGGLTLRDGADALRMVADLPDTAEARDVLTLVRRGVLRGLSVNFHALQERLEGGVRVIERAVLDRIAVVDRPAYGGALVEARATLELRQGADGVRIRGRIPHADQVVANTGRKRKRRTQRGALVWGRVLTDEGRTTIRPVAYFGQGSAARPLASTANGSLEILDQRDGIVFDILRLPNVSYIDDLLELLREGLLHPNLRMAVLDSHLIPERGNPGVQIEVVDRALLQSILLLAHRPGGLDAVVDAVQSRPQRRARVWL